MDKNNLKIEIERKKLTELYELKGSFLNLEVLKKSKEIDKLIIKELKKIVS